MSKSKLLIGLSCLVISGSVIAAPSFAPGSWSLGLGMSYYRMSGNHNVKHDNTNMPFITGSYNLNQTWAIQGLVGRLTNTANDADRNKDGWLYLVDGVYRFHSMPQYKLQPYAVAGLGIMSTKESTKNRHNPMNVNAGVGVQYFLNDQISLDANVRDIYTLSKSANDIMVGLGFNFAFGGASSNTQTASANPTTSHPAAIPANTGNAIAHFALNSARVTPADKSSIKSFAANVKSGDKVVLKGYADDTGSAAFNQFISQKRADSVKYYLEKDGMKGVTVTAKGYGNMNPAADNTTANGRAQNRRVEAEVIS